MYSLGDAEIVLGKALKGKRSKSIISTKASFQMGEHPNGKGSSRYHLMNALEDSLGPGALEKFEKVASSNMHDMNNYATMLYKNFCKLM